MIVFGPVPSRRLGSSLGINHIPPKNCSYSCVYCQVGRTTHMEVNRQEFYPMDQIFRNVEKKISQCVRAGVSIDYLTLVPDGEPTLDRNLGNLIQGLQKFSLPVAVISNASLTDRQDIQDELSTADWVSLKVDAIDENLWRRINRPHRQLSLSSILEGMLTFRKKFKGELVTESMLVSGLNDNEEAAHLLCDFLLELQPFKSYLSIPTRPPAETDVIAPSSEKLQKALQIFSARIPFAELLFETEVGDFVSTGDLSDDIRSILAVHPLREEAPRKMIDQAGADDKIIDDLLLTGDICSIFYRNERFFVRRLKQN